MKTKKIGILGGTFDPIHNAHISVAEDALREFQLDSILFIPTHITPLKDHNPLSSPTHRLNMLKMALEGYPHFIIDTSELDRKDLSYSLDTLVSLQNQHPNTQFYWIIGSDKLKELHKWHRINDLSEMVEFIVAARPDFPYSQLIENKKIKLHFIKNNLSNISSTLIREYLKNNQSISHLVPESVQNYIKENNLYHG